jgi:hypothetical protein
MCLLDLKNQVNTLNQEKISLNVMHKDLLILKECDVDEFVAQTKRCQCNLDQQLLKTNECGGDNNNPQYCYSVGEKRTCALEPKTILSKRFMKKSNFNIDDAKKLDIERQINTLFLPAITFVSPVLEHQKKEFYFVLADPPKTKGGKSKNKKQIFLKYPSILQSRIDFKTTEKQINEAYNKKENKLKETIPAIEDASNASDDDDNSTRNLILGLSFGIFGGLVIIAIIVYFTCFYNKDSDKNETYDIEAASGAENNTHSIEHKITVKN